MSTIEMQQGLTRRTLLRRGVVGATLISLPPAVRSGLAAIVVREPQPADSTSGQTSDQQHDYLSPALAAARWLKAHELRRPEGLAWPIAPDRSPDIDVHLYGGTAGVVLFLIELYNVTGDDAHLADASAGADYLLANLNDEAGSFQPGLYTGFAGIGFTLEAAHQVTKNKRHLDGARRCVTLLREHAKKAGKGIEWSDITDIIGGSAGVGLYLLDAAGKLKDPSCLELATGAGRRLIELADEKATGLDWPMSPTYPRRMPNFSHGTAGIAYFLATLHQHTKDAAILGAAVAGGKHVLALSKQRSGTCLVRHHEPGGEELFYLGWCHGPPGTGRLFHKLHQITGDPAWMEWVHDSAREMMGSGIPKKKTPGFWNNLGVCCGSAGVAGYFLDPHQATGRQAYLEFAWRMAADLLEHADHDQHRARWVHAEHRIRPKDVAAQTGLMQGAAGIGMLLLRFHLHDRGMSRRVILPDNPF